MLKTIRSLKYQEEIRFDDSTLRPKSGNLYTTTGTGKQTRREYEVIVEQRGCSYQIKDFVYIREKRTREV